MRAFHWTRTLLQHGICASFLGASRYTWYGRDPFPVLLGCVESSTSLITEQRALGEAKRHFIEYYAKKETVPENMPGPYFHQNLFLFMLYGDPALQAP